MSWLVSFENIQIICGYFSTKNSEGNIQISSQIRNNGVTVAVVEYVITNFWFRSHHQNHHNDIQKMSIFRCPCWICNHPLLEAEESSSVRFPEKDPFELATHSLPYWNNFLGATMPTISLCYKSRHWCQYWDVIDKIKNWQRKYRQKPSLKNWMNWWW